MGSDFDFAVNASREGVQLKKMIGLADKWHWHDVALSEHGFHASKRFTNWLQLDQHSGQNFGDQTVPKYGKKSFLN